MCEASPQSKLGSGSTGWGQNMDYRDSAQEWAIHHRWMHIGLLSTLLNVTEMPKLALSNSTDDGNHLLELLVHYLQSSLLWGPC
jgi:hypothetical protein